MTHAHTIMLGYVVLLFTYSFYGNNIGDTGAQALAKGLQYCSNLLMLRLVHSTTLHHVLRCIALRQACDTRKYLIFGDQIPECNAKECEDRI